MHGRESVLLDGQLNKDKPNYIIFCDVDGVLNNMSSVCLYHLELGESTYFDKRSVDILKTLCKLFDAKVVLSSSWRRGLDDNLEAKIKTQRVYDQIEEPSDTSQLVQLFKDNDIPLIGRTDEHSMADGLWDRAGQIVRFVDKYLKPEDKWVVLDDDPVDTDGAKKYTDRIAGHFVETSFYDNGLSYQQFFQVKEIFTGEKTDRKGIV